MKKLLFGVLFGFWILGFEFSTSAEAAPGTTPGTVTLMSTLECISVRAKFTGDDNANNSATIQFKKTSDPDLAANWRDAYPPFIDRRNTIGGTANPYVNQARGSIVGLSPNTSYDVKIVWRDDGDGVSSQPAVTTISTLSSTPPASGSPIPVSNDTGLTTALNTVLPGQTIKLSAGTYSPFTITRSGTNNAWIVIDGGGFATVNGSGVSQNIAINADYVVLKNMKLAPSDFNAITIGSNRTNVIVQDNTIQNVGKLCADGPKTTHNEDSGVLVGAGSSSIFILHNSITSTSFQACIQPTPWDGPGQGIGFTDCTTCVIDHNTVTGAFRDAITSDNSLNVPSNVDISNNTVTNYVDDGIESKGENLNVRAWGNIISSYQADTCFSNESTLGYNLYGPTYYFRNTCKITGGTQISGGCGFKGPSGPTYFFQNSLDASGVTTGGKWGSWVFGCGNSPVGSGPYVVMNNASLVDASMYEGSPANATTADYNVQYTPGYFAYNWNGSNYDTFASFKTGTAQAGNAQEAHGKGVNPLFKDSTLQLQATSPAIDAGVILPNFNDAKSVWAYTGSAPDAGAFETGGTTPPPPPPDTSSPTVPSGLTANAASSSQINLSWTASMDNVGVAGYKIFRGATQVGTSGTNSYSDSSGLTASTAYTYKVSAYDGAGNTSAPSISASTTTLPAGSTGSTPYSGTPAPIPGTIEAENYDLGGEGVAYHDMDSTNNQGAFRLSEGVDVKNSSDLNGGYAIGWIEAGEWQNYSVNVTQAGSYTFSARVAAIATGGSFHVDIDGVNKTGTITVPVTATAWNTTWGTVTTPAISLSTGSHVMHVVADSIEFDLNNFTWTLGSGTPHPADTSTQDWKITLNEATQYGSCWKSAPAIPAGCPTPAASLDNSVRAGTIWNSTSNGSYHYDSSKQCPLCWVAP